MTHLEEINMSYFSHLYRASKFGILSITAGIIFIFHGIFPNCCVHTGSELINKLHTQLNETNNNHT